MPLIWRERKMYRILGILLFIPLGLFSHAALAWNCATVTPSTTISPQNITIPRDLPVGSVIGTPITTPLIRAFNCWSGEQGVLSHQIFGVRALGRFEILLNGRRMYRTDIPGVGYSVSGATTICAGGEKTITGSDTIRTDVNTVRLCENESGMIYTDLNATVTITFYKIASETGSGTIPSLSVASLTMLNNLLLWHSPEAAVNINAFTITTPACNLQTTFVPVNMKDVDKKAFNGKGTTPGDAHTQSFTLPMVCNAGTRVSVKMEGNIFDANKGVLNITGGTNAATGVGLQLLYNNQPMVLGSDVAVGTSSSSGGFSVPLKARYYQTGDSITTGTANGVAAFTITYH
ncbi:fimbrial protein [Enterobacter oligotrophicus]|uniref:fimbrial protein n=2 Tax=Enterobacter oligotrophicus TaxID=2478464 RepID=UPI0023F4251E|nr:fimbrial protein [Enterobacter oligotrophicus]